MELTVEVGAALVYIAFVVLSIVIVAMLSVPAKWWSQNLHKKAAQALFAFLASWVTFGFSVGTIGICTIIRPMGRQMGFFYTTGPMMGRQVGFFGLAVFSCMIGIWTVACIRIKLAQEKRKSINGRKVKTEEDYQILNEAYAEAEELELETEEQTRARIKASEQAEVVQAVAEAQAVDENETAEKYRRHLC